MRAAVPDTVARLARPRRCGFTLIEVMVALCIVAIGLGGAATLHLRSQRTVAEAARLSDGVRLAAALAERMRANPVAMARPDAANPYLGLDLDADADNDDSGGAGCYGAGGCEPDALASLDLAETARQLGSSLPGGRIVTCRDAATADAAAGAASWRCDAQPGAPLIVKLGWRTEGMPAQPWVVLPVRVAP